MSVAIVWFRKSLRLDDNPALLQVCSDPSIQSVLPIYILDPEIHGESFEKIGHARIRFLLESLEDLSTRIKEKLGQKLLFAQGNPHEILSTLARILGTDLCLLTSDYCSEPYGRTLTDKIEHSFHKDFSQSEVRFHEATHTLLDIEAAIADPTYKNPKNMKDILRIFHSRFGTDGSGFLQTPEPLPEPTNLQSLPEGFDPLKHP